MYCYKLKRACYDNENVSLPEIYTNSKFKTSRLTESHNR